MGCLMSSEYMDVLVEKYDLFVHVAMAFTHDIHDARDAVQSAYVKLLAKPPRHTKNVPGLMMYAIRSCCLDQAKKMRPETGLENTVDASVRDEGFSDEVQRALRGLSPEYRDALLVYALDGLSYEEVGQRLGIPKGTVSSRLMRARTFLKEELKEKKYN